MKMALIVAMIVLTVVHVPGVGTVPVLLPLVRLLPPATDSIPSRTNAKAQAPRATGGVIPGLYAAGNATRGQWPFAIGHWLPATR